jgi:hypothetical protein
MEMFYFLLVEIIARVNAVIRILILYLKELHYSHAWWNIPRIPDLERLSRKIISFREGTASKNPK